MPRAYIFGWVTILRSSVPGIHSHPAPERGDVLSFTLFLILPMVQQPHDGDPFHHTGGGVAQEFTVRLQGAVDADIMFGRHEEVARFRRVVGGLFGDIVPAGAIGVVPVASESLSKNGIQRFLHPSVRTKPISSRETGGRWEGIGRTEV